MPRVLGVDIPDNKKVAYSLRYIYGIGPTNSVKILKSAKIDLEKRAKDLSDQEIALIRAVIEKMGIMVEGELKRMVVQNIKRLKDIQSYKGTRHQKNLPVRGQNTQKNARTKRGKRVAVGGANPNAALKK